MAGRPTPSALVSRLRKLKPHKLKAIREAKGLSWRMVGKRSGVNMYQYAKMENGTTKRAIERNIRAIARALDTHIDMISEKPELADIEQWANYHNLSRFYATQLAREGRIEGAYKDQKGTWRMEMDAEKLGPTEESKRVWRERYEKYLREYQRKRRRTRSLSRSEGQASEHTDSEASEEG